MNHSKLTSRLSCGAIALSLFASGHCAAQAANNQAVDAIVAVVNDDVITRRDLNARVRTVTLQAQKNGANLPAREVMERQVLERSIVDRALMQFAKENGVRADEATVDIAFANLAQQNKLTVAQFKERIEKEGISLSNFRSDLAQEIVLFRLRDREVEAKINITEAEVDAFLAQNEANGDNNEWNIAQILLAPASEKPSDIEAARMKAEALFTRASKGEAFETLLAEASNASDANRAGELGFRGRERTPELFLAAVEALQVGQISKPIKSPAGFHVLKLVGKRNVALALGNSAQQTKAAHILLRTNATMTDAQAQAQLLALRDRIMKGQIQFADAAKAFSVDGSAPKGGELGWLLPGDTVPEFDNGMNGLKTGEMSAPVRSQFGWHLILVQERRTQEVPAEKIRQLAKAQLRERKSEEEYIEFARRVRDRAYVELRLERP